MRKLAPPSCRRQTRCTSTTLLEVVERRHRIFLCIVAFLVIYVFARCYRNFRPTTPEMRVGRLSSLIDDEDDAPSGSAGEGLNDDPDHDERKVESSPSEKRIRRDKYLRRIFLRPRERSGLRVLGDVVSGLGTFALSIFDTLIGLLPFRGGMPSQHIKKHHGGDSDYAVSAKNVVSEKRPVLLGDDCGCFPEETLPGRGEDAEEAEIRRSWSSCQPWGKDRDDLPRVWRTERGYRERVYPFWVRAVWVAGFAQVGTAVAKPAANTYSSLGQRFDLSSSPADEAGGRPHGAWVGSEQVLHRPHPSAVRALNRPRKMGRFSCKNLLGGRVLIGVFSTVSDMHRVAWHRAAVSSGGQGFFLNKTRQTKSKERTTR